jgi:hypothetical protein
MNLKTLLILTIALVAGTTFAAPPGSAAPASSDGLIAALSRNLDEVYLQPGADLSAYKKVIVEPGQAALAKNWLKDMNATRSVQRRLVPDDAQRITDEAASSLAPVIADVFKARGYEIVSAPGPGVLLLTPRVTDLYVNAPDVASPGIQRAFVRDGGQATLHLDVRDAVTGTLVARIVDRSTAHEVLAPATSAGQLGSNRATDVSNLFWFEALYRQWAGYCAKALGTAPTG